jgi:plasmid maintenance system antidote protein VapI
MDAAAEELATEIKEAAHLMRLTNRRFSELLANPDLTPRELTQIRKALNSSMKTAPQLLATMVAAQNAPEEHQSVDLTLEDIGACKDRRIQ